MLKKLPLFTLSLGLSFALSADTSIAWKDSYNAYDDPSHQPIVEKKQYQQWFVGPVIAFTPITVDVKHPAIEPSLAFNWNYGTYNDSGKLARHSPIFSIQPFVDFQFAANKFLAFEILASSSTSFCKGASSTYLNDTEFNVGFQVSTDAPGTWIPDFRILFEEVLPTGKYDKLKPSKHGTDLTGQGAFETGVNLVFQKFFPRKGGHNIRISGSVGCLIPSAVKVKGINYYGGNKSTNAKVYPGTILNSFFVLEYAFSRTWGMTIENNFIMQFPGKKPHNQPDLALPTTYQFSIAPEIQHTLSPNLGLVAGTWFSLLGRNSNAFAQAFLAVLYIF